MEDVEFTVFQDVIKITKIKTLHKGKIIYGGDIV